MHRPGLFSALVRQASVFSGLQSVERCKIGQSAETMRQELSSEHNMYINSTTLSLRENHGKEDKEGKIYRMRKSAVNAAAFWLWHSNCSHDLTAPVATWTKFHVIKNPCLHGRDSFQASFTIDESWQYRVSRRERIIILLMTWPLVE